MDQRVLHAQPSMNQPSRNQHRPLLSHWFLRNGGSGLAELASTGSRRWKVQDVELHSNDLDHLMFPILAPLLAAGGIAPMLQWELVDKNPQQQRHFPTLVIV